jgi:pantothenate kinase
MDYAEETATTFQPYHYKFRDLDIVIVEGIFIFKKQYCDHFNVSCWIDCSFETALERAVHRRQEDLSPAETVKAFETIYLPRSESISSGIALATSPTWLSTTTIDCSGDHPVAESRESSIPIVYRVTAI